MFKYAFIIIIFISGSHIADLVGDLVRKSSNDPIGWREVGEVLKHANTPRSMIGNAKRRKLILSDDIDEEGDTLAGRKKRLDPKSSAVQKYKVTFHEKGQQSGKGRSTNGW